jgi:hypothetical protein
MTLAYLSIEAIFVLAPLWRENGLYCSQCLGLCQTHIFECVHVCRIKLLIYCLPSVSVGYTAHQWPLSVHDLKRIMSYRPFIFWRNSPQWGRASSLIYMIWYDMIYDVWCDMIYDTIWNDMTIYDIIYDMMWCDVIWYDIWHITRYDTIWYDIGCDMIYVIYDLIWYDIFNCNWVDTRWQQYSAHLHSSNTQNTENGTYITIKKLNIHT